MNTLSGAPVVVGYDGSPASAAALDVGAEIAAFHHVPLRIVHAYVWPILFAPLANVPFRPDDWIVSPSVYSMIGRARARILAGRPDLVVDTVVAPGAGMPLLTAESAGASLVVIGRHGIGGVAGTLAGSVASALTARAACPVMIVGARADRPDRRDPGPSPLPATRRPAQG